MSRYCFLPMVQAHAINTPPEHNLQGSFWTVAVVTSSTNFYKPMSPFRSPPGRNKQSQNCVHFLSLSRWLTARAHEAQLHWRTARAHEVQLHWQHVQMRHNFTDSTCRWGTTSLTESTRTWGTTPLTACADEAQLHWQHVQMRHNFTDGQHVHIRHNFTDRQHMHMRHNFTDWWHVHIWHNFTDSMCRRNTISSGCSSLLLCSNLFHMFDWVWQFLSISSGAGKW